MNFPIEGIPTERLILRTASRNGASALSITKS